MTDRVRQPEGYHIQAGCWSCKLAVRVQEMDTHDRLYCTFGAPTRPACGGYVDGNNELFCDQYDPDYWKKVDEGSAIWDIWRFGREVDDAGICPHHEEAK